MLQTAGLCQYNRVFFFNDTATTEIYPLSLHDALPISASRGPKGYKAFAPGPRDDGTLAPTAALSSLPYVPAESLACLRELQKNYRTRLWGTYGFADSFNLAQDCVVQGYLANDWGPIAPMIENYLSGLCWK